ncbi:MAG: helix-turn-helix domain-containing protein [Acidiferrobacterales bacterium]|nr:helix-turn-helix domain-containing protein [Acidiferrobacterales bacterium]
MARSKQLIDALKVELKRQGMTYKSLAVNLGVSESTIKQMFSNGNFSLKRLDSICELLDSDLNALLELSESIEDKLTVLDIEQEQALVEDTKLLVVAYCLVNHWAVEEIVEKYNIDQFEIISLLAKLDKMKLIELLPSNKVRLLMANNFHWQNNGPIEKYFRAQVQTEFFNTSFDADGALRVVKNGVISKKGQLDLHHRLKLIDSLFDEISQQERKIPLADRQGVTMILAIRSWQLSIFTALER